MDSGTSLLLYGDRVGVPYDSAWVQTIPTASGRVASCVVDVAPLTWGSMKRLYELPIGGGPATAGSE